MTDVGTVAPKSALLLQLEAEAAQAESEADAEVLTDEQAAQVAAIERIAKAHETREQKARAKRQIALTELEAGARVEAAGRYLVKGIDLVSCFPVGTAPPVAALPNAGVIVVRSDPEPFQEAQREIEHKKRPLHDITADLLCQSVVRPAVKEGGIEATRMRAACKMYAGMVTKAGDVVFQVNGAKSEADKRGRG